MYENMPQQPKREKNGQAEFYLQNFNLDLKSIKEKTILDIGCGEEADFVKFALDNGVNNIVGIDSLPPINESVANKVKGHYIVGDIENLPFEADKFDLILMRSVINPDTEWDVDCIIADTVKLLKPGGKLEIYPVWREKAMTKKLKEAVKKLDGQEYSTTWQEKDLLKVGDNELHKDLLSISRPNLNK